MRLEKCPVCGEGLHATQRIYWDVVAVDVPGDGESRVLGEAVDQIVGDESGTPAGWDVYCAESCGWTMDDLDLIPTELHDFGRAV